MHQEGPHSYTGHVAVVISKQICFCRLSTPAVSHVPISHQALPVSLSSMALRYYSASAPVAGVAVPPLPRRQEPVPMGRRLPRRAGEFVDEATNGAEAKADAVASR